VISEWQYRNLTVEMSALGYRTQEPSNLVRENPRFIPDLVVRLQHNEGHTLNHLAATAGLLPDEFAHQYIDDPNSTPAPIEVTR
jgi:hypothetical protein